MSTTTTWADIQRLASDLQRVQLAESAKRLTDSNCVELVGILMSRGLIDLVISADGKEYITRKYLQTECANECLGAGGRIALTELAAQLNVDLDHVNTAVGQLLAKQRNRGAEMGEEEGEEDEGGQGAEFVVCASELVHRDFINDLCTRLDARLQELGHLSMLQLTRQWELPTELLNLHILPQIGTHFGTRISAIRFEDQLCTIRYISSLQAKLRALLIALTKPMPLADIHAHLAISQSFFFKLWNELADQGKLPGKLIGTKNSLKSLYVPNIHEKLVKEFAKRQIAEHHYIECSILKRLSISAEPVAFFRDLLPAKDFQDLLFWPSVVLSESKLWRECDSLAKNLLQSNHFCLLEDILPSQFPAFLSDEDYSRVVERLQQFCNGTNLRGTEDRSVVFEHPQLVQGWLKGVEEFVGERAEKDAPELRKAHLDAAMAAKLQKGQQKAGPKEQQKEKEESWEMERPGKKGGKGAKKGGQQMGKGGKKGAAASEEHSHSQQQNVDPLSSAQIPLSELLAELQRKLPTGFQIPPALWEELAEDFGAEANKIYRNGIAEAWQKMTADSGEQQEMRRAYEGKMAKVGEAYAAMCTFQRGAEALEESMGDDLICYLLRSLGTELANSLLLALADPTSPQSPASLTQKQREQLIGTLESTEMQKRIRALFDSLQESGMEKFHEAAGRLANLAGFMLKQPSQKERMDRVATLGVELREQLAKCVDAPTSLLLAILLSFHHFHSLPIHASGKFVSALIAFLVSSKFPSVVDHSLQSFPPELASLLNETQRLVVASIKRKGEENEQIRDKLGEKVVELKEFFAKLGPKE